MPREFQFEWIEKEKNKERRGKRRSRHEERKDKDWNQIRAGNQIRTAVVSEKVGRLTKNRTFLDSPKTYRRFDIVKRYIWIHFRFFMHLNANVQPGIAMHELLSFSKISQFLDTPNRYLESDSYKR